MENYLILFILHPHFYSEEDSAKDTWSILPFNMSQKPDTDQSRV